MGPLCSLCYIEALEGICERNDEGAEKLREIVRKIARHEWIIGTAYDNPTHNFGWQVNVRRPKAEDDASSTVHYDVMPRTFALEPEGAGLLGLLGLHPTPSGERR
jgi:uncharacterized membrane-anchored protein